MNRQQYTGETNKVKMQKEEKSVAQYPATYGSQH